MRLPQRTPLSCNKPNPIRVVDAISPVGKACKEGTKTIAYSATTIVMAALVPQVEIQSLRPTTNPAYVTKALCATTNCPPERGSIAPNFCNRKRTQQSINASAEPNSD